MNETIELTRRTLLVILLIAALAPVALLIAACYLEDWWQERRKRAQVIKVLLASYDTNESIQAAVHEAQAQMGRTHGG